MDKKILYHGSAVIVDKPDLKHSRVDLDFGAGFYVTEDMLMAEKWACNKRESVLNTYVADLSKLKILELGLTKQWLHFIIENRNDYEIELDYKQYDVITGPVADDKMYRTISDYEAGYISVDETIKLLNSGGFSHQYCFRTQKAIESLKFQSGIQISDPEKAKIMELARQDRKQMEKLVMELKKDKVPKFRQKGL